jgi:hypothetical protein
MEEAKNDRGRGSTPTFQHSSVSTLKRQALRCFSVKQLSAMLETFEVWNVETLERYYQLLP